MEESIKLHSNNNKEDAKNEIIFLDILINRLYSPRNSPQFARILKWVAFLISRGSSQPRDQTQVSLIAGGFLYQLSYKGNPRILERVAYPFSSRSSQPRNWIRVSCTSGGFFTNWAIREAPTKYHKISIFHKTISRLNGVLIKISMC